MGWSRWRPLVSGKRCINLLDGVRYECGAQVGVARAQIIQAKGSTMKPRLIAGWLVALTGVAALLVTAAALAADVHVMISAGFSKPIRY